MTRVGEFGRNAATNFLKVSGYDRFKTTVQFHDPTQKNGLDGYIQNLFGYADTFKKNEQSPFFTSEEIGNALGISSFQKTSQSSQQIQRLLDLNHDGGVDTTELATTIAYVDNIDYQANGTITKEKRQAFKDVLDIQAPLDPTNNPTDKDKQRALKAGKNLDADVSDGIKSAQNMREGMYLDEATLKMLQDLGLEITPVNTPENLAKASTENVKAFQLPLNMVAEQLDLKKKYEQFRLDTQA